MVKLSMKLIETYSHINQLYYQKQKKQAEWDDADGNLIIHEGDMVDNGRYRLIEVIKDGSKVGSGFGQVVKAIDTQQDWTGVAIKVVKNKPAFRRQGALELELL